MRSLTLHGKIIVLGSASLFLTIVLLIGMGLRQVDSQREDGEDLPALGAQPPGPVPPSTAFEP